MAARTTRMLAATVLAVAMGQVQAKAEGLPSAGSITIQVLSDRNFDKSLSAKQVEQYNTVLDWMEKDLVNVLSRRGSFKAELIKSRDEFKAGADKYLLVNKIVKYNPGAKAARMLVGFGAGAASIDTHFELFGQGEGALLAKDHGVGSGREWTNCARKLNEQVLTAINDALKEPQAGK